MKFCEKEGPLRFLFPSERNSRPIRGYTVYSYNIYIWTCSCDWKGIDLWNDKMLGIILDSVLLVLIIMVVVTVVVLITAFVITACAI